jgi:hypothetical protein
VSRRCEKREAMWRAGRARRKWSNSMERRNITRKRTYSLRTHFAKESKT